eukprot:g2688.t1
MCLGLGQATAPSVPRGDDLHDSPLDTLAARRAAAAAGRTLALPTALGVLAHAAAAACSSMPAVHAYCLLVALGLLLAPPAFLWLYPAFLQYRWWQAKRALWAQLRAASARPPLAPALEASQWTIEAPPAAAGAWCGDMRATRGRPAAGSDAASSESLASSTAFECVDGSQPGSFAADVGAAIASKTAAASDSGGARQVAFPAPPAPPVHAALACAEWRCSALLNIVAVALPVVLVAVLVIAIAALAVAARSPHGNGGGWLAAALPQVFGREDVLPVGAPLWAFFKAQGDYFAAVLPLSLITRGVAYERADVFDILTRAHAALAVCPAVDSTQGNDGVIDWYTLPSGPSPSDRGRGAAVKVKYPFQTPLAQWALRNDSASDDSSHLSLCDQWAPIFCNGLPVASCLGWCNMTLAGALSEDVPRPLTLGPFARGGLPEGWPGATALKLWAGGKFTGQSFVRNLAFANASAASTLDHACWAGSAQIGNLCANGADSRRLGPLLAGKADMFSRALADPRDLAAQRAVRDQARASLRAAVGGATLGGRAAAGGSDGSGSAGADRVFVHSLLFVVLEQFDALRAQMMVNVVAGAVAQIAVVYVLAVALAALQTLVWSTVTAMLCTKPCCGVGHGWWREKQQPEQVAALLLYDEHD